MGFSVLSHLFLPLLLLFVAQTPPTFAVKKPYVVYLGSHAHGSNPNDIDTEAAKNSQYSLLESYLGSAENAQKSIFYSYTKYINGFAAMLEEKDVERIKENPNVVSVFPNKGRKLHTTRSWEFLNLERDGGIIPQSSIWKKARFGEDTIIGNLDTGVWPESKSFSDDGLGPIPSRWRGICQNDTADEFHCNRKLIGARFFNKGYNEFAGNLSKFRSVRDTEGHGSHTLSTAGGSFVAGANVFKNGNGTAKGGSPHARVAAYKVCGPEIDGSGCFDADILAAFDAAISDGVDVLSVSLGGSPSPLFEDGIAIGSLHAVREGIAVIASAGNDGPSPSTVSNVAPWIFTVGASTVDREFESYVSIGNKKHFKGASLSDKAIPKQKLYPLVRAVDAKLKDAIDTDAEVCLNGTIDPKKVKGKIVVCLRGQNARVEKSQVALSAGAVGMILANDEPSGNDVTADAHLLPASHVSYTDGQAIYAYLNSTKNPKAYITAVKTVVGTSPAPFMAAFSSRGPNTIQPAILKPDITAPGVNIIAAYTEAGGPTGQPFDKRRTPFNTESGTSMSAPHVAGVVGLLKTLYPHWSPAAIKSAIMTTSRIRANNQEPMLDASFNKATPFDYGSGHIRPNRATDPGLIYDLSSTDYIDILCSEGYSAAAISKLVRAPVKCTEGFKLINLNYPSITVPDLGNKTVTVTRRVKNVGPPGTYTSRVRVPRGVKVTVYPKVLKFGDYLEEKEFKVVLEAKVGVRELSSEYVFGELVWSDGKHVVRSPITVRYNAVQGQE